MERYNLPDDLRVFGVRVRTFPDGISEAFDGLAKMIPDGIERAYYGISICTKDGILYSAAALETYIGEGDKYNCETYLIPGGEYLTVTIRDWYKNLGSIKDVFDSMLRDERVDRAAPCIEWYKTMEEMLCMVKMDPAKEDDPAYSPL